MAMEMNFQMAVDKLHEKSYIFMLSMILLISTCLFFLTFLLLFLVIKDLGIKIALQTFSVILKGLT